MSHRDLVTAPPAGFAVTGCDVSAEAVKRFVGEGLEDGAFRPTIARTFPFDQIADAHRFIEAGEQVGKVVVTL